MEETTRITQKHNSHIESIITPLKEELLDVAMKTKPTFRSDFIIYKLFLCPEFAGDYDERSRKNDCEIQIEYLEMLENEDAIKKFDIKTETVQDDESVPPYNIIVAKIIFCPLKLIEYFKIKKSKISFSCKNGYCFIKFSNKPVIKIAGIATRQCKLLKVLFAEAMLQRQMGIESVFEEIKLKKDENRGFLSYSNKKEIISNTIKEIQRILKAKGHGRKIKFSLTDRTVYMNYK